MSLIARLIEAGTPADLIEEVAMLLAEQKVLEKRRAAERERQARHRVSRDITLDNVTPVTSDEQPPLSPPNDIKSNPPHTPPDQTTRARKGPVPNGWQPGEFRIGTECRKVVDGWPPGELKRQVEHFRAHHQAKGNSFKDVQCAWQTWVLNSRTFGRVNGTGQRTERQGTRAIGEQVAARLSGAH